MNTKLREADLFSEADGQKTRTFYATQSFIILLTRARPNLNQFSSYHLTVYEDKF